MENYPELLRSRLNDPAYEYRRDSFLEFLKAPVRTYKESPTVKDYVEVADSELERMIYAEPVNGSFEPKLDDAAQIVMVNDILTRSSVPEKSGVIITDMATAIRENHALVEQYVYPNLGRDRTEHLINAAWRNGLFIYIPDRTDISLRIHQISDSRESYSKKSVIICGKDSSVKITDIHVSQGNGNGIQGQNIYCHVGENSTMQYSYLQDKENTATDLTYIREFMDKYARFRLFHVNHGSSRVIFTDESVQMGESSDFRVYGVNFSSGTQKMDIRDSSFQVGTASSSDIQVRGVVTGKSSTIHRGNIDLEEVARNSTGFYDSRILLLSKNGYANSKPGLMIKNANTRSKHASSISDVDEDQVFYLRSRGIGEAQAKRMITAGFVESLIERGGDPEMISKVNEYAEGLGVDAFLGTD